MQVFESVSERFETAVFQEATKTDFHPRGLAQGRMLLAPFAKRCSDGIGFFVLRDLFIRFRIGHFAHAGSEIANSKAAHGVTQPDLSIDFVAFSDSNVSHVVAKPCDFEALRVMPCACSPNPSSELLLDVSVLP